MRVSPRHIVAVLLCAMCIAGACASPRGAAAGPVDAARGAKYFMMKCNSCHPHGGQGAGPALLGKVPPGPLKVSSTGGRHNVPALELDSLLAYVTPMMQPVVAPPAPMVAPAVVPAPGMKTCDCTCQCPLGTPAGQLEDCVCACSCPAG